jgi:hypothetical protein
MYTLKEAKIVIEGWRQHYDTIRHHSSQSWFGKSEQVG